MGNAEQLVVFSLDRQRFALPLAMVRRVVRAAEVTAIPNAPGVVSGVVDVQGEVIAVLDVRARLGMPHRPISLSDQFLIARTRQRSVALVIDQAQGLVEVTGIEAAPPSLDAPWFSQFQGVAQLNDGLVLIQDLEKFLSPLEACVLDRALEEAS
ncbi:MAG TPA: chemotaxis protein CheW [Ramlibacter sp.]|nr:chemotaxis protein CheW [Ramlibacter sp.]